MPGRCVHAGRRRAAWVNIAASMRHASRCMQAAVRAAHFPAQYAEKLSLAHVLQGHGGCVNRMAWNADGSLLLSGSDDRRVGGHGR
jgi:hypothetical protein